jgi:hypothetical protein
MKAAEVRACATLAEAADEMARCILRRRCLFVCDDLWPTNGKATGFFADLNRLIGQATAAACCSRPAMAALEVLLRLK